MIGPSLVYGLLGLTLGCSCTSQFPADTADAPGDPTDSGPFVCGPPEPPFFSDRACSAERDAECQRWAQQLTPAGSAISRCSTVSGTCTRGDLNCDRFGTCLCNAAAGCVANEVCVSDPPGAAPRCLPICIPME